MRYWQSYRYVFNTPNWLTNLALGGVCSLIPWIGQIVLIGYSFEIIDVLLRRCQRQQVGASRKPIDPLGDEVMDALPVDEDHEVGCYPDFTFNRFSEYLTRGIWPFLVRMIVNLVIGMIAGFLLMAGMMLAGFAAAASNSPILFIVVYALFWLVYAFLMMVASIFVTPLYLRAGLSGDFASAFSMEFYRDFLKRVGKELILAEIFMSATGMLAGILGLLLCYIGIFPAIALIMYAHHHLEYQVYELYLERGGMPVQCKDKTPVVAEDYQYDERTSSHVMRPPERSTDILREDEDW